MRCLSRSRFVCSRLCWNPFTERLQNRKKEEVFLHVVLLSELKVLSLFWPEASLTFTRSDGLVFYADDSTSCECMNGLDNGLWCHQGSPEQNPLISPPVALKDEEPVQNSVQVRTETRKRLQNGQEAGKPLIGSIP